MLSPFGTLFEALAKKRGLSKRDLAKIAGTSSGKLTETLRDRDWAKANDKRWYAPDLSLLPTWARIFKLAGDERAEFEELAIMEHCPPEARALLAATRGQLAKVGGELALLGGQHTGLLKELRRLGIKLPKGLDEGRDP